MAKGILFDRGSEPTESYDPVVEFYEDEETYFVHNGAYLYEIPKAGVVKYVFYDLCETCKYELDCCRCEKEEENV